MAERIIDHTKQAIMDLDDLTGTDKDKDEDEDDESTMEVKNKPVSKQPTITCHKRSATMTSPKQRKHKQPKRNTPPANAALSAPEDTLSATDSLGGGPSRRPSRRPAPSRKARKNEEYRQSDTQDK